MTGCRISVVAAVAVAVDDVADSATIDKKEDVLCCIVIKQHVL